MESTPSYSSEERGTSRDRDGKERSYQPSPPAERFNDPRREEAPRPPRAPLEGVIHIRPAQETPAPAREAVQTHMQQQFEQADRSKDKDDKRVDRPVPQPVQTEPTAPVEARTATEASAETPTLNQQRTEAKPASTEQDEPKTDGVEPAPQGEQPMAQPGQPQEDTPQPPNGFQHTWYYTPPRTPAQSGTVEYPAPVAYAQEQPLQRAGEAAGTPLPASGAPEAWRYDTYDASQAKVYGAEQPVGASTEADEAAAWHYGAEQPSVTDRAEQSAPVTPHSSWEASKPDSTEETPATSTPWAGAASWFGGRSARTPSEQPTVELPTAPASGGDGPRPPRNPYESSYGYGGGAAPEPAPTERYTSHALVAPTPSARLERLIPHEHPHTHRDLAMGIVGGLLLVHVLSKRRDNKLNERINQLQKENSEAHEQTNLVTQELQQTQQAMRTEQQQTQAEIAKLRDATPVAEAQPAYVPTAETRADVSGAPAYAAAGVAAAAANKAPNQTAQQEQRPQTSQAEQQPDANQQQEYVDQNGNPVRTRPGEHVKHSAWHTYVEKDGHVVQGAIEYGRGFQQEQQQEMGHTPQFGGDQGAAQGPVFGDQGMYGVHPSLPSGMVGSSLPAGQPTHADAQHQLPEHTKSGKQVASNVANPWFWLMLALIFAAFFITITV